MGRPSDPDGKAFWVARLDEGVPRGEIAQAFLESTERMVREVTKVYADILRRPPDEIELFYWLEALRAGGASPHGVRDVLLSSAEFFVAGQSIR